MQLTINVSVSSDDGKTEKAVTGKLMVATEVYGTDAGIAKQDFLQQAETLVRLIAENQVPALYDAVQQEKAKKAETDSAKDRKMRDRLKAIRDKRKQKESQKNVKKAHDETQPEDQAHDETQQQEDQVQEETQTQEEEQ